MSTEIPKEYMPYAPIFKSNDGRENLQLFAAMKKGGHLSFLFVVDHDQHLSATGYLTENPKAVLDEYDYVRTATIEEFQGVFG
jgi:hypothetical protein